MAILNVSDNDFQSQVLESTKPVLLDFWAEWCGPCKRIAPILETISEKFGDKLVVAKMNVDENPSTPTSFGVRGIPMLVIIKDGQVVSTKVGLLPADALESWVSENL